MLIEIPALEELRDISREQLTERKIKILMVTRGLSQQAIAVRHQINQSDLCRVIKGERRTPRIRQAIANELGLDVQSLWPARSELSDEKKA